MYTKEEIKAAHLDDFRVFLREVWKFLGFGRPTKLQNDMAWNLQHAPDRFIIQAFRGAAKSYITVAFAAWLLFMDPQTKVLIVSANGELAENNAIFLKRIITGMPLLQHLTPRKQDGQRDKAIMFDVGPATPAKDPSVKTAGILGQITGSRADFILPDDVEVPKNSYTQVQRERIAELVKEFASVLKPGGRIVYLGTPQVEDTLYLKLLDRGYTMMVWPAEVPKKPEAYNGRLAPFVQDMIDAGVPAGTPVEPDRFPTMELVKKLDELKAAGYALQMMLDTTPADVELHPLKTRDLIIHDCDADMGHVKIIWGSDANLRVQDLQSGGFDGDYYVRAQWKSEEMAKYSTTVMAIDPSGRGQDETGYSIVSSLHSMLYLRDTGGFLDGFGEDTLKKLAFRAVRFHVNYIIIEENYGGGMFNNLLKPVLIKVATDLRMDKDNPDPRARPPSIDEEWDGWSSTQKELRILDTLEPVMKSHRLVVDRRVIDADLKQHADKPRYSLIQQMTRMARIKGCLQNEDRLETLAMACGYFSERMRVDGDKAVETHKANLLDEELKAFKRNAFSVGKREANRPKRKKWRNW